MKRTTLVAQEPIALFQYEVRPVMTVLAHSADEARDLAIECLNRGMCNTYKMLRHISHDAAGLVVAACTSTSPRTSKMTDFQINGSGTVYMLSPLTDESKSWVEENVNVPDYASADNVPVEHRYIEDVTLGILNDGLTALINGQEAYIGDDGGVCKR